MKLECLRRANLIRLSQFKNAKGLPAHVKADGSDWKLSAWSNATLGELGEAANIIKKIERGDFELEEKRAHLAEEFADVVIYLDLMAAQAGIDLATAVVNKFNKKSEEISATVRLGDTGDDVFIMPARRAVKGNFRDSLDEPDEESSDIPQTNTASTDALPPVAALLAPAASTGGQLL